MRRITTILFDLDNTLVDFLQFKKVCCSAAVDAMITAGLKIDKKSAIDEIYGIYRKQGMEDHFVFDRFLERFGKVDQRKLAKAIVAYRKARKLKIYPNTEKTLKILKDKGYRLIIVTEAPILKAWIRLASLGIDGYFGTVISGKKPKAFTAALRQLKLKPGNCIVVGDNSVKDIIGAKRLGIRTCFARYGSEDKQSVADYEIRDVGGLVGVLDKLI